MRYRFVTTWDVDAPVEAVWGAVSDSLAWPRWWRGVEDVEELEAGGPEGMGSLRRYTWKSALPYRLAFDMRVTQVERHERLEGQASGELAGRGTWTFTPREGGTRVEYLWDVETTRRWMNLAGPLLKPAFRWNHDYVMRSGAKGLGELLGAEARDGQERERGRARLVALPAAAALAAAGVLAIVLRRGRRG
jgi:uncharacterized protein YndB with AHSA1/START domain